jgi:hypothetical protein
MSVNELKIGTWTTHEVDKFPELAAACASSANNAAWGSNGGVKGLVAGGLNAGCIFIRGSIVGAGVGSSTDAKQTR